MAGEHHFEGVKQSEDIFDSAMLIGESDMNFDMMDVGHCHSDFDSDFDNEPEDEYSKLDEITYLEKKVSSPLH